MHIAGTSRAEAQRWWHAELPADLPARAAQAANMPQTHDLIPVQNTSA